MRSLWVALVVVLGCGVCLLVSRQLHSAIGDEKDADDDKTLVSGLHLSAGVLVRLRQLTKQSNDGGRASNYAIEQTAATDDDLSALCYQHCVYAVETAESDDDTASYTELFRVRLVALGQQQQQQRGRRTLNNDAAHILISRPIVRYATDEHSIIVANYSDAWPMSPTETLGGNAIGNGRPCLFAASLLKSHFTPADYDTAEFQADSLVSSLSVVNLCRGMFGALATESNRVVFIEPTTRTSSVDDGRRLHLLFRNPTRSADGQPMTFDQRTFQATPSTNSSLSIVKDEVNGKRVTARAVRDRRWRRRRRRGANSWDYFIEVMVVIDSEMRQYHGSNLENYVLTLFSTVASIYRHHSLGAAINIVVVKIHILEGDRMSLIITENAQDTLRQFCRYQHDLNDANEDSANHHDVAILLTRKDICRGPGKCDTLGLAELGTMCDSYRSCAIIEDNGLSAAFTIAHELGHVFNIPHDDEKKCGQFMALEKYNYHIMAPTLEYNTHPWSWSPCSTAMLQKFLDTGRAHCLHDKPVEKKYFEAAKTETAHAGIEFDVDQQCKFVFGPSSKLCPYMPACKRLWCATYYGYQMGCRTQHMPWADGTPCGTGRWCYRGDCVGMGPQHRRPTNGAWGTWQDWGSCSRTCGGGVKKAKRDCDNPRPEHGGKYCVGLRLRYRSCNIDECPWDSVGFREQQCAAYNDKDVATYGVPPKAKWVPKYLVSQKDRCKLYCSEEGKAAYYLLQDRVEDGTPCDRHSDDICVDGECKRAGCDHRLESNVKVDRCGVCGGDGTGCRSVSDQFSQQVTFGYNIVTKIPAGAANIEIRQKAHNNKHEDDNYLALQNSKGEFILNGHYQVSVFTQDVIVQGSILQYSGSDHVTERINSTVATREDVFLHVLSVGDLHAPQIQYEYVLPKERRIAAPRVSHFWRMADDWSQCSNICQGRTSQKPICVNIDGDEEVADSHCPIASKPDLKQKMCNIDCHLKWATEWATNCSSVCGTGERQQHVYCVKSFNNSAGTYSIADERMADKSLCTASQRPSSRVSCHVDCEDGYRWSYSQWTDCTVSCDGGHRRRQAVCVDRANQRLDDDRCKSLPKEQHQETCNVTPCPTWHYNDWTECTKSCDGGVQIRHTTCLDAAGREVPRQMCNQADLVDRRSCAEQMCTRWKFHDWSSCSVSCGDGTAARNAECVDSHDNVLAESNCDKRQKITSKACRVKGCPTWRISEWSQCSKTCTDGLKKRRVECVDENAVVVDKTRCLKPDEKYSPQTHQSCNLGLCPFWRIGDWSACSVTCGNGIKNRTLECVHGMEVVDENYCMNMQRPEERMQCRLSPCPHWEVEPWNTCSVTCGRGVHRRRVLCMTESGASRDSQCNSKQRPHDTKECFTAECPIVTTTTPTTTTVTTTALTVFASRQRSKSRKEPHLHDIPVATPKPVEWITGPWTPCYGSCERGQRKRQVVCKDLYQRILDDIYCRISEKPLDRNSCIPDQCSTTTVTALMTTTTSSPSLLLTADTTFSSPMIHNRIWTAGPWTSCSKSCGADSVTTRRVWCLVGASNAGRCNPRTRPPDWKRCVVPQCTTTAAPTTHPSVESHWYTGDWQECSQSCGGGTQLRLVVCAEGDDADGEVPTRQLADAECAGVKPAADRRCNDQPCPPQPVTSSSSRPSLITSALWHVGVWSPCSKSCGKGTTRRLVVCVDGRTNQTISETQCGALPKPIATHRCRKARCPRWRRTKWSEEDIESIPHESECSTTCGPGVRSRTVTCYRGRKRPVSDVECSNLRKASIVSRCMLRPCPSYHWKIGNWSNCSKICQPGRKHRSLQCLNSEGKKAPPRVCDQTRIPITVKNCLNPICPYEFQPGPWTACSQSCGTGIRFRSLRCVVKKGVSGGGDAQPASSAVVQVASSMCSALPRPTASQKCSMGECRAKHRWMVDDWSACSTPCGVGVERRRVRCVLTLTARRVHKKHCPAELRPERRRRCFIRNCEPGDCAEIKQQKEDATDGDYFVLVSGFRLQVYCHAMNESHPQTFITLKQPNVAEMYNKRLLYPFTCPHNGLRNDSCECKNNGGNPKAGKTIWEKIRVDLRNMKVNTHDFTFAQQEFGKQVAYGSAGDCYSAVDCPQGEFIVDLRGTGFRTSKKVVWVEHGHRSASHIEREQGGTRVHGKCGGYCGECHPNKWIGLLIEIDRPHKKRLRAV